MGNGQAQRVLVRVGEMGTQILLLAKKKKKLGQSLWKLSYTFPAFQELIHVEPEIISLGVFHKE